MAHSCRAPAGPVGLAGADQVVRKIGCWPCFHDAEVVELALRREGESMLTIHALDPRTNEGWVRVVFTLRDISGLELQEFSSQNVINELEITSVGAEHRL